MAELIKKITVNMDLQKARLILEHGAYFFQDKS